MNSSNSCCPDAKTVAAVLFVIHTCTMETILEGCYKPFPGKLPTVSQTERWTRANAPFCRYKQTADTGQMTFFSRTGPLLSEKGQF